MFLVALLVEETLFAEGDASFVGRLDTGEHREQQALAAAVRAAQNARRGFLRQARTEAQAMLRKVAREVEVQHGKAVLFYRRCLRLSIWDARIAPTAATQAITASRVASVPAPGMRVAL